MSSTFIKDPDAELDYQWNWAGWLVDGDTIDTYTLSAPAGLTLGSSTNTTTAVTAWLSGGTLGAAYDVRCRIVTADGRTDDRTLRLTIRNR